MNLYKKQSTLNRTLEDASRMLSVPRRALHVTATGKGLIAGHLTYVTRHGTQVDVETANQGKRIQRLVELTILYLDLK